MMMKKMYVRTIIASICIIGFIESAEADMPEMCESSSRLTGGYDTGFLTGGNIIDQAWNGIGQDCMAIVEETWFKEKVLGVLALLSPPDDPTDYVKCRYTGYVDGIASRLTEIEQICVDQCILDGQFIGDITATVYCDLSISLGGLGLADYLIEGLLTVCGEEMVAACEGTFTTVTEGNEECVPYTDNDVWRLARHNQCVYNPLPNCGDGNLDDGEQCDDGNNEDGDGCASNCTKEPPCMTLEDESWVPLPDGTLCEDGVCQDGECVPGCQIGTAIDSEDNIDTSVLGDVALFAGGVELPAGQYAINYVDGCMKYAPERWWSIHARDTGYNKWWLVGEDSSDNKMVLPGTVGFLPGTADETGDKNGFEDFEDCVAANKLLAPAVFNHTGGTLGIWLADSTYWDNVEGIDGRNPEWSLVFFGECPGQ
jgi:cysteine-rich repeat protein